MDKITFDSDKAMNVLGVDGRLTHRTVKPGKAPELWFKQRWISASRPVSDYGAGGLMKVEIRFDDELGNGHNSFAITADITTNESRKRRDIAAGGCLHEEIAGVFPELAPLIRWHLCDTDGPMHYLANVVYFAGDRDCNGLRQGEKRQIKNGRTGVPAWHLMAVSSIGEEIELYKLEKSVGAFDKPDCPWTLEYRPWCRIGEGKARELDTARSAAIWPDATDAELCQEPEELKAALVARLPALLAEFRKDMEAIGFYWSPLDFPQE